jgi:hypothetical protein
VTIGLLSAFGAAVLYGVATLLQAVGLGRAARSPDARLVERAWTARLYVAGLALDGIGFLASVAALRTLPLFVVESAVASSVAVTAVLVVCFLGERLGGAEILALAAVGAGLVGLAGTARPGGAVALGSAGGWLLLAAVAPVGLLGLVASRSPSGGPLLAVAAGLGFGGTGIAAAVAVARRARPDGVGTRGVRRGCGRLLRARARPHPRHRDGSDHLHSRDGRARGRRAALARRPGPTRRRTSGRRGVRADPGGLPATRASLRGGRPVSA